MNLVIKTIFLIALVARTCCLGNSPPNNTEEKLVLFISFDGFRYDYLTRTDTPNFDRLIQKGVHAEYIYDAYITKTLPNHYTIITGLYEESHGIVANNMYDPDLDQEFHIGQDLVDPVWWQSGEPLWTTNQRQGGHSGVVNYAGSDVKIRGVYPTFGLPKYNASIPYNERVDILISLFVNGSINLGVLYFEEPDQSGHYFGPESDKMEAGIQKCDRVVGYLIDELQRIDIYDKINIVISSDHGMAEVSKERLIFLEDYIDTDCCRIVENNPIVMLWPHNDSDVAFIYQTLVDADLHIDVFLKEDIPDTAHYSNNVRIPPILVVGQENWMVHGHKINTTLRGTHGYNNTLTSMHPFFIAHGPSFKEGYQMKPFRNVDIYPLLCNILEIEPSPNNGSLEDVKVMLKEGGEDVIAITSYGDTTSKPSTDPNDKDSTNKSDELLISQAVTMQAIIELLHEED